MALSRSFFCRLAFTTVWQRSFIFSLYDACCGRGAPTTVFSELPQFRSLRSISPYTKTLILEKNKTATCTYIPDKKSLGLGSTKRITKNNVEISTIVLLVG